MKDKEYLMQFVNNIMEDNLSDAKSSLQAAVAEKLKERMKIHMQEELKGE